jgi:hypothetical protein
MTSMNNDINRALIAKELAKASAALGKTVASARYIGDAGLAAALTVQHKQIADHITRMNGGPVKLTTKEMLGAFR